MNSPGLLLLLVGAGVYTPLTWSTAPELSGLPTRPRPPETAAQTAVGSRVYLQRCAGCHGRRGDGRGWAARSLAEAPRDFTAGVFKVRSTPTGSIPTDEDLFAIISRGMHGTAMLPWRGLPEEERWALVGQVKSFSVRFREEQPAPSVIPPSVPAGPDDETTLAAEGRQLWERVRCGACHGAAADGRGPGVALLRQDPGRQVRVRDLASAGQFLRGTSLRDIYLTLQTGMDGTPMASYAGALSARETWALAAYVRTLIRRPAH